MSKKLHICCVIFYHFMVKFYILLNMEFPWPCLIPSCFFLCFNIIYRIISKKSLISQDSGRKTENRKQKTEDRRQKTEDRRQKTEDRGQKTENRKQKTENRKQRAEDRKQKTEDRKQKTENRRQRTEDRRQKTENRGLMTEDRLDRNAEVICYSWRTLCAMRPDSAPFFFFHLPHL